MPRGGYRKPSKPAAFSGVGRDSKRTDGGPMDMAKKQQPIRPLPANGQYGARAASVQQQSSAPMAAAAPVELPKLSGLFDPTARPNEAVTSGSPIGAGPGPEALTVPNTTPSVTSTLRRLAQVDETGDVEYVLNMLNQRGIS